MEHKSIPQKSPNYPNMSLDEAIGKAKILYEKDGKAGAPKKVVLAHLGYNTESGPALRTISTLRKFDLITDKDGRILPSQRAIDLLVYPKNSERYISSLRGIALKPIIYNKLWNKYQDGFPSDEALKAELIDEYNFNPKQVERFIYDFKKTVEYAGLDSKGSSSFPDGEKNDQLKVGDYVEWESQGVLQFEAKKITGLSDDGTHAFVEGSNAGLPIEQLSKVQGPMEPDKEKVIHLTNVRPIQPSAGMKQDTFTLDEGQVTLQWPSQMSRESYEDFKAWLDLIAKKAKRAADKSGSAHGSQSADDSV